MKALKPLLVLIGIVLLMACGGDTPTSPTLDDCVGMRRCVQPEFAPDPKRLTVRLDSTGQVITSSTTVADTVLLRGDIITQGGFDSARVRLFRNGVQTNSNGTKTKAVSYRKASPLANDSVQWKQTWEVWRGTGKRTGGDSIWVYGPKTSTPPPPPPPDTVTPPPPDTVTPPPPPTNGIAVSPGQSIQTAVNGAPEGATFILKAGTHRRQTVTPKHGQTFVCEPGTVLDGELVTAQAFRRSGADPDRVTIRSSVPGTKGCTITRYNPGAGSGVVYAGGHAPSDGTDSWLLEDVEVSHAETGTGVIVGHRMTLRRVNLHHNDVENIAGNGIGILMEDSECAWGNYRKRNNWGFTGGCSKFVLTDGLVVRRTYVHDNWGAGLWTDIDNIRTTYQDNRVEDNAGPGIYHEISYSARITGNQVRRNGSDFCVWAFGAGIQISSSGGTGGELIEIANNVVENNCAGIAAVQQNRGSGAHGPYLLQNLWVHDNTVVTSGQNGVAQDVGWASTVWGSRNLKWDRNTYRYPTTARPFTWLNALRTWAEWRGYGQDLNGTIAP